MLKKVKKTIIKVDRYLFKIFGSEKSIKLLQNIKEAQEIFSILNTVGEQSRVRFVGGCVRKALSGESIDDIDLATSLKPNEVKEMLIKKNIRVLETGISHGTLTIILNNKKFEITTLRKDIATDGRHANVEYTLNWEEDALRRDFTINAIYADIEGRIFDPLKGISDLKDGKIKFIGSTEDRIAEDYLRILRYFRFFIQYSNENYEESTIKSIKKNINGLNKISNERIFDELQKILKLKNLYSLFSNRLSKEIILNIFPQLKYFERLKIINSLSQNIKEKYDNDLILALIIVDETKDHEYFCHKYRTSNELANRFKNISKNYESIKNKKFLTKENIKKMIYLLNKKNVKDLLLFSFSITNKKNFSEIERMINFLENLDVPKFPISGDYLKNLGYKTGPELGDKLKLLEKQWIESDFVLKKETIEKSLKKINNN